MPHDFLFLDKAALCLFTFPFIPQAGNVCNLTPFGPEEMRLGEEYNAKSACHRFA